MTDLVQRLRDSATQARALDRSELLNEAADEIERLRTQGNGLAEKVDGLLRERQELYRHIAMSIWRNWIATSERLPEDGAWCWVDWDGPGEPFPAMRDSRSAGGWTNTDCWEDFDRAVTRWMPLPAPPTDAK